jgi:hypothetical protein
MERRALAVFLSTVLCVQRVMGFSLTSGTSTEFPTNIPADEVVISLLENRQMVTIPQEAFEPFFQLTNLTITHSPLYDIPNLIPVGTTLRLLILTDCQLRAVNATVLNELRVLQELSLAYNTLQSFPQLSAGPQHSLELLELSFNLLTGIPEMSFYTALRYLMLNDNRFSGEAPAEAMAVPHVNLDRNSITSLPPDPRLYQHDWTFVSIKNNWVS